MKGPALGKLIKKTNERSAHMPEKSNIQSMDMQARTYFDSMPQALKEQIVQSGVKLCTKEDLEQYCKNALGNTQPQR